MNINFCWGPVGAQYNRLGPPLRHMITRSSVEALGRHARPSPEETEGVLSALEEARVHYCLWCYTPDHTSQWGDNWNLEV